MSRKSKGLPAESITLTSAPHNFLNPSLNYLDAKIRVRFSGSCLKQDKSTYTHGKIVNIYIVHEINKKDRTTISDPTIENCLFGAVSLTKNVNIDKYEYSGCGIGFDRRSGFSFPGGRFGQNVLIFGADMRSSTHIDNKKKDILVLGKGPTQGLENTLTAVKFIQLKKKKVYYKNLSLHYNGANSYLFVNGTEISKFKVKDSEIVASPLCLANIRLVSRLYGKDWIKWPCL